MIEQTCVTISELQVRARAERGARYARRNKIRAIDRLIDEFEMLNLADEVAVPGELRHRATRVISGGSHPLVNRPDQEIAISDWMEALYDLQDTLMLPGDDDLD